MKKTFVFLSALFTIFYLSASGNIYAQEEASSETSGNSGGFKEQIQGIKQDAQEARSEEKGLRDQMKQAMQSGDYQTAKDLRDQLHSAHQENIQEMKEG